MNKILAQRSAWLLMVLLAGCASIGLESPATFKERLAEGYTLVTGVRSTAETLLVAGKISVENAESVQAQADTARSALDVVRTMGELDVSSADARLNSILLGLTALQEYLKTQENS